MPAVNISKWKVSSTRAGPDGGIPLAGLQAATLLLVFRRTSLHEQQLYFPAWFPEGLSQQPFPEKLTESAYLSASSALNSACLAQATLEAHQPHLSIWVSLEEDVLLRPRTWVRIWPQKGTFLLYFHLAQCGKFLSSNKLQAKQLLTFFLSLYWLFALKKRLANPVIMKALDGSRCSVGRICVSASTELCQCTFVLANSFTSRPWPLQCRRYQVRKNWDVLLGGFELWILAYRKCYACFLPWPDAALLQGFQRQKVEQD